MILFFLSGCKKTPAPVISFYYWKTILDLNKSDIELMNQNGVQKIYVRYFDVVKKDNLIIPDAKIKVKKRAENINIIPVVYIKNEVFEKITPSELDTLIKNISGLISEISNKNKITSSEIQFDCDWTEKTKKNYFAFLSTYQIKTKQKCSVTIRLHQIKYIEKTGIPPVDKGILMYYNMGRLSAGNENSIYQKEVAHKYISYLKRYPMKLDLALPIFSWGLQIRNNQVMGLLNKMNTRNFENDTNFICLSANHYRTKNPNFKSGYYFRKSDYIKIERVTENELLSMASDLSENLGNKPGEILFYDLDSVNYVQYQKDIFQKVQDRLN